ncbi:uncharacterized protein N7479_002225, partial [Penicillium vulpinum]|uniref:uncharacterized protein n=1 Tax=Penicillium vulpinum TaxID=29845 RepID=UPI002547E970
NFNTRDFAPELPRALVSAYEAGILDEKSRKRYRSRRKFVTATPTFVHEFVCQAFWPPRSHQVQDWNSPLQDAGAAIAYSTGLLKTIGRPQLDTTPFLSQALREPRAFEYYFYKAGPWLSCVLDQAFWRGSLFEIRLSRSARSTNDLPFTRYEVTLYSRSLALLQQRIKRGTVDLIVFLISCILFIAIGILQGSRKAAQILYKQGTRLILVPYQQQPRLSPLSSLSSADLYLAVLDKRFISIKEVRNVLCSIVAEIKAFKIDTKAYLHLISDSQLHKVSELVARQQRLKTRLSFSNIDSATTLLLIIYTSVFIKAEAILNLNQSVYNAYESKFAQIIDLAPTAVVYIHSSGGKQPPFIFEIGVFLSLFITGLKYPFPKLRSQVLRYIGEAPTTQGLFIYTPTAHIVAIFIMLEENLDNLPGNISQVYDLLAKPGYIPPVQHRTCDFSVSTVMDKEGKTWNWLNYILHYFDEDGKIQVIDKTVLFPA